MPACSICTHSDCTAIESALVAGQSYRSIAGQYQVSKSALMRHTKHSVRSSSDRASLRHQAQALQRQAQGVSNLTVMAQVLQKMARLLVQLCEREEYRS